MKFSKLVYLNYFFLRTVKYRSIHKHFVHSTEHKSCKKNSQFKIFEISILKSFLLANCKTDQYKQRFRSLYGT